MNKIPFLRPNIVKHTELVPQLSDIDASRIYSNFGPLNTRFEKRVLDEYFDNTGALTTVNNATIGLILAISQTKREKGKYAIMPSFTFAATPLAAMWCGLEPFFVDIRQDNWCMDEKLLAEVLENLGNDVAVVIPYATFGLNMNLNYYRKLHESGIPVVIDAAASFGVINGRSHFGIDFPGFIVYSFHATKSFGIGEGGLLYSANTELISHIRKAENFGFSENRETTMLALNGKMSEYTAAIALATLDIYQEKIKLRQQIYSWYLEELSQKDLFNKGWTIQAMKEKIPYQFMPICTPSDQKNTDIIKLLASKQIEARTYFSPPCHQHPLFMGYQHTTLNVTEKISQHILSLPLWEEMTKQDVQSIIEGMIRS